MNTALGFLVLINLALTGAVSSAGASEPCGPRAREYGIHLFFNEKEFVDVLSLTEAGAKAPAGMMQVPDDFTGALQNIIIDGESIDFDLPVPKNAARPADLLFHYHGRFFAADHRQLTGAVTLKGSPEFLAAFVGFAR